MSALAAARDEAFCHEAFLYAGLNGFVEGIAEFIRGGVAAGEPVLVVVSGEKIRLLQEELSGAADAVCFADMAAVGANPALIINAWHEFLRDFAAGGGRRARGVGEPIWAARSAAELVEAQRHETLLNVAFAGSGAWTLLCPYDVETLPGDVIQEATRSHPWVVDGLGRHPSHAYEQLVEGAFEAPLADPPEGCECVEAPFGGLAGLDALRVLVAEAGARCGLGVAQVADLVLAMNEVATNSVRYGGGAGLLRLWVDEADRSLVCEVRDGGRITDPLVGRVKPGLDREGGRGLWLANQLCDLVQIRSYDGGTVVRLHQRLLP